MAVPKFNNYHTSDDEPGVDSILSGDTRSGVVIEDCELIGVRRNHWFVRIDGIDKFIHRSSIIRSTLESAGDVGEIELDEQTAIDLGLV